MSTDFLPGFSRAEYPNDRNLWLLVDLGEVDIVPEKRIEFRRRSLIAIYTIQPDAKKVHIAR
jgi:hypothetical protein